MTCPSDPIVPFETFRQTLTRMRAAYDVAMGELRAAQMMVREEVGANRELARAVMEGANEDVRRISREITLFGNGSRQAQEFLRRKYERSD